MCKIWQGLFAAAEPASVSKFADVVETNGSSPSVILFPDWQSYKISADVPISPVPVWLGGLLSRRTVRKVDSEGSTQ